MDKELDMLRLLESQNIFEIRYCKPGDAMCTRHISDIKLSKKFGSNYIDAFCEERHDYLTFKIDRICEIRCSWVEIFDTNEIAPQDGVYIFACKGDNHIEFEMYRMHKGEKLWKYFLDECCHMNGWFVVEPLAFHYIGFYPEDSMWMPMNSLSSDISLNEFEVIAYQKGDQEIRYALKLHSLWPEEDFIIREPTNNRFYDEEYWKETTFIANHNFFKYTEDCHARHRMLYDEMNSKNIDS